MGLDNLRSVVRNAIADGYVALYEARNIEKYALKDDNTVTRDEKAFLQDAYEQGAYFEPRAHYIMERLVTYGDNKISDQMDELRRQKQAQHWFNSDYVEHATPVLEASTDSLTERFNELRSLKREANLFTSDYADIGKKLLLNSNDSIAVRMSCLDSFKREANIFTSEFKEIGTQMLLNSYDTKTARLMALDQFKSSANLFSSEYREIADAIRNDS